LETTAGSIVEVEPEREAHPRTGHDQRAQAGRTFRLALALLQLLEKGSSLDLRETAYRGKIRPWGKTKNSLRTIPIPKKPADDLWLWKQDSPNSSPEAFMFAKNPKGEFVDSGNFRNRVLHRLAKELQLPKLTFQVIRRSIATLAQKKGSVKDVQGMLRHIRTATTTDVYMQEIPEGVEAVIEAVNAELGQQPQLMAAG
jgi:integrase